MKIYISAPSMIGNDSSEDARLTAYLKKVLSKDGHSIMTYHELFEKTKPKKPEQDIMNVMVFINNNPIDMLIFVGNWRTDKKCLAETFCARSGMINISEYLNKIVVPVDNFPGIAEDATEETPEKNG